VTAPTVASVPGTSALTPHRYRVLSRAEETRDTVTLALEPMDPPLPAFRPGQFAMLTAFGIGEVPVSMSGIPADPSGPLVHTVRAVGAVTRALHAAGPGEVVGVRGPYGTDWAVEDAAGRDLVIVAGGIGLAPLRPLVRDVVAGPERYGRLVLLVGARTPADLLFTAELTALADRPDVQVEVTVDRALPTWPGHVGVVTGLLGQAGFDPENAVGFVCGPELMMRLSADALVRRGVAAERVRVSLERNMQCGVGQCGHCQFGPLLLCRDGPVVRYDWVASLLTVREL